MKPAKPDYIFLMDEDISEDESEIEALPREIKLSISTFNKINNCVTNKAKFFKEFNAAYQEDDQMYNDDLDYFMEQYPKQLSIYLDRFEFIK